MGTVACSTSICPAAASADAVLDHWDGRCRDLVGALSIDRRYNPRQQERLLRLCRQRGIRCLELVHPARGAEGLVAASAASTDRGERREAGAQVGATLKRAADHGVELVQLAPVELPLTLSRPELAHLFARGEGLVPALDALRDQRCQRAAVAMDGLCSVLDPLLRRADDLGILVILPSPAPWPQLFPRAQEVEALLAIFAGAPLAVSHGTDWAHVEEVVAGASPTPGPGLRVVRLADACGLTTKLPLGVGEVCWDPIQTWMNDERDQVWTFRADTTRSEVVTSQAMVRRWGSESAGRAEEA